MEQINNQQADKMTDENSQSEAKGVKAEWEQYGASSFIEVEKSSGKARISWPGALALLSGGIVATIAGLIGLALMGIVFWTLLTS